MPRKSRRQRVEYLCSVCDDRPPFCYVCAECGFQICVKCLMENEWGMSCNKITWECPNCGHLNML